MHLFLLLAALASDPAGCPMHAKHATAHDSGHHANVDRRGDHVMGFSHEKTKHAFRLLPDGGAIEVRANDERDVASIDAIRTHLQEIAKEFREGKFGKPVEIHGRTPDGADVMKERAARIAYRYEELPRGARVRIVTSDAPALEAVHAFLRFQIDDHRTGDSGEVEHQH